MHPIFAAAVADVRSMFPAHTVTADELPDGSVLVILQGLEIGDGWAPAVIDLRVKLQPTFPTTPPYPFYAPAGLARTDGRSFAVIQPQVAFEGEMRAQISLTKPFDASVETLGTRFAAVLHWLHTPS